MPNTLSGIFLPAGIAEHEIAGAKVRRLRRYDFGNAAAGHHGVRLHCRAIGGAVHPGAVGGVQRDQPRAQQRLAVLRLGHGAVDQLEMSGRELSARLLHQQDLAIDGGIHAVLPWMCPMQSVPCKSGKIPCLA
jgi:hypothetical protein